MVILGLPSYNANFILERALNPFGTSGRERTHKTYVRQHYLLSFFLLLLQRDLFVHN